MEIEAKCETRDAPSAESLRVERRSSRSSKDRNRWKNYKPPKNKKEWHLREFHNNRHRPLDDQISKQILPLVNANLLGKSFFVLNHSLPSEVEALRYHELIRDTVGRFIREGPVLIRDLKSHLGRWDPDLKAAAVAAKAFASLARLICADEWVDLSNRLEEARLSGSDPINIYGPFWGINNIYMNVHYRLECLLIVVNELLIPPTLLIDMT